MDQKEEKLKYEKEKIITITLAVLLVGGALLASNWVGQVSADSGTTTEALTLTKGGPDGSDEDLAAALGISVEDLTAAEEKTFTSAVDKAIEAEYITASQAESLKAGSANFRSLYRYLSETERAEFDQDVYLAEALGISAEELQAAIDAVKQAWKDAMVADGTQRRKMPISKPLMPR